MATRPLSGSRALTLPPVQTTRSWRGSSAWSRTRSSRSASSTALRRRPGTGLGAEPLEHAHHVILAASEVVVEPDVLAVQHLVRRLVRGDRLVDDVAEPGHRLGRVDD